MKISTQLKDNLLRAQRNEITEHHIYRQLAAVTTHEANRAILQNIADDEKRHYEFFE